MTSKPFALACNVAVVGGGPAGLMAAQTLQEAGLGVHLFDAMPTVGRKFLLAGIGGLNLTHSEDEAVFRTRYGARAAALQPALDALGPAAVRDWAAALGVSTFVGSSGRVFPQEMKAAPLLRAWLRRLRHPPQGEPLQVHTRQRWLGWGDDTPGCLRFAGPQGALEVQAQAVVLALGGASWPQLGSDGAWVGLLAQRGVACAPLRPANCGFDLVRPWSEHFRSRFAGQAFKSVAVSLALPDGTRLQRKGEFVATDTGVEGSLIYAVSAPLRDAIAREGVATLTLDLLPDWPQARVLQALRLPRGGRSMSNHLRNHLHVDGIKAGVLHEVLERSAWSDPEALAATLKALPLSLGACRPLAEAISTAGGVRFEDLDAHAMLTALPGTFVAGEMLDWEAPTGGYLLTASLATGRWAAQGVVRWLRTEG